jgi:two-component system, LuxR family, response regulator FixJ
MIDALPKLITVVDDDESVRESLFDLLEVYGYSVRTYSSAEEFLGSAHITDTNCLILDISMPVVGGLALYEELRRRNVDIPVVFMTGHAHKIEMNEAQHLGPCLYKPFSGTALRSAIESVLRDH